MIIKSLMCEVEIAFIIRDQVILLLIAQNWKGNLVTRPTTCIPISPLHRNHSASLSILKNKQINKLRSELQLLFKPFIFEGSISKSERIGAFLVSTWRGTAASKSIVVKGTVPFIGESYTEDLV